jgi:chromosome segregation ATPase
MRNTAPSPASSPKEELPALLISQQQQTETPMTAKQFWFKNFTGQSIFEVMEDYAREREQALVKTLDDRLQSAEAKRTEAQGEAKQLKEQLAFCEQSLEQLQKTHTKLLHSHSQHAADGDL